MFGISRDKSMVKPGDIIDLNLSSLNATSYFTNSYIEIQGIDEKKSICECTTYMIGLNGEIKTLDGTLKSFDFLNTSIKMGYAKIIDKSEFNAMVCKRYLLND